MIRWKNKTAQDALVSAGIEFERVTIEPNGIRVVFKELPNRDKLAELATYPVFADMEIESVSNLFARKITWHDSKTETVAIDSDYYFNLDGDRVNLVGMYLTTGSLQKPDPFFSPDNLKIYDKELKALSIKGLRLIHTDMGYARWWATTPQEEVAAYKSYLDLLFNHKMLVIPSLVWKDTEMFDIETTPDFSWQVGTGTDSLGEWTDRITKILSLYPNIVAVNIDFEFDYKGGQTYTAQQVDTYLKFVKGIVKFNLDVPVIHKLMGGKWLAENEDIKEVCLANTDIPAMDIYDEDSVVANLSYGATDDWLKQRGYNQGWWLMEVNGEKDWGACTDRLNRTFIDKAFINNARIASLFGSYINWLPQGSFFDKDGKPVPKLIEVLEG